MDNKLIEAIVDQYRARKGAFADEMLHTEDDDATARKILKTFPSKNMRTWDKYDKILGGVSLGGAAGASVGGLLAMMADAKNVAVPAIAGGLAGAGAGGMLGHKYVSNKYKGLDALTPEQKIELIKKYNQQKNLAYKDPNSKEYGNVEFQRHGELAQKGGLISALTTPAALAAMIYGNGALPELSDKHLDEIINFAGLKGKLNVSKPKLDKAPFFMENAFFSDNPNAHNDGIVGTIKAISKRLFKPGVMAHEVGHGNIHNSKDLAGMLQRNLYAPTTIANQLGAGMIPTMLSYKATKEEDSPLKGALKGGLIGSLFNAGVLVPEFEASRRGINYLRKSSLPTKEKILNSLGLAPAFLTYLGGYAGPSMAVGGMHAYQNKKKKLKEEKKRLKEQKQLGL